MIQLYRGFGRIWLFDTCQMTDCSSSKLQKSVLCICAGNYHWSCNFQIVQWQLRWKQTWLHTYVSTNFLRASQRPGWEGSWRGALQRYELTKIPGKNPLMVSFANVKPPATWQIWVAFHSWKDGPSRKARTWKDVAPVKKMIALHWVQNRLGWREIKFHRSTPSCERWTISDLGNAGNDASSERLVFREWSENNRLRRTSGLHCSLFFMLHSIVALLHPPVHRAESFIEDTGINTPSWSRVYTTYTMWMADLTPDKTESLT